MGKETINNEEKTMGNEEIEAVKKLVEKLPPEDLEKAAGGMDKRTLKMLRGLGLLTAGAVAGGIAGYHMKKIPEPEVRTEVVPTRFGDVSTDPNKFFGRSGTGVRIPFTNVKVGGGYSVLKKEFAIYNGMIFRAEDMAHDNDGIVKPKPDAVVQAYTENLNWDLFN